VHHAPAQLQPTLMVCEATGGWQCALVAALAVAQLPFAVVNPRQVRDWVLSLDSVYEKATK
jgi:transposase